MRIPVLSLSVAALLLCQLLGGACVADVRDCGPSLISDIDGPPDVTQARRYEAVARR